MVILVFCFYFNFLNHVVVVVVMVYQRVGSCPKLLFHFLNVSFFKELIRPGFSSVQTLRIFQ